MAPTRSALHGLIHTLAILVGMAGCAPVKKIPFERVPADLPSDVRSEVQELYSRDPRLRGEAAHRLGNMGPHAAPAIPFLVDTLADQYDPLVWVAVPPGAPRPGSVYPGRGEPTSAGYEAAKALVEIGEAAVQPLIWALKHGNWNAQNMAAWALGQIRDARATEPLIGLYEARGQSAGGPIRLALARITGQIWAEPRTWREWWNQAKGPGARVGADSPSR